MKLVKFRLHFQELLVFNENIDLTETKCRYSCEQVNGFVELPFFSRAFWCWNWFIFPIFTLFGVAELHPFNVHHYFCRRSTGKHRHYNNTLNTQKRVKESKIKIKLAKEAEMFGRNGINGANSKKKLLSKK